MSLVNLTNQSKFMIHKEQVDQVDYFNSLFDENILLANYNLKAYEDLTDSVVQYLTSAYPGFTEYKTVFTNFLKNTGRTREVTGARVRWKLKGNGKIQMLSKGNLMPSNEYPGLNFSDILIWLDTETFRDGDTISPESEPRFQIVLKGEPVAEGDGYRYVGNLATWEANEYLEPGYLEDGIRWKKMGSSKYSEGSRGWGSMRFGGVSWVEFETDLSKTGKSVEFTDEAHKTDLTLTFWDDTYKNMLDLPKQVVNLAEMEFLAEINYEKECDLLWGRSSRAIIDTTTGKHRRIGPGLFEFLEDGNVSFYSISGGSMDLFEEALDTLWFDRIDSAQGNIVVYTGREGIKLADKWIRAKYGDSAVVTKYEDYVDKVGESTLKFKSPLFTMYQIPTYGVITFEHWPALDSRTQGGPVHPKTGKPLTSYEFVILDYGLNAGGSGNIELLNRKNSKIMGYQCGTYSPAGPINQQNSKGFQITHPGRSYNLYHGDEYGLRVKDITATLWLRPNVA